MDGRTFDAVARRLGTSPSRRSLLTGLIGSLAASLAVVLSRQPVEARKCTKGQRPCNEGGCKECCKDQHCRGKGTCDNGTCSGTGGGGGGGGGGPLPDCAPPPYGPAGAGCNNTPTCTCVSGTTCFQGVCCIPNGSPEESVTGYFCCENAIPRGGVNICCGREGLAFCTLPSECCSGVCLSSGVLPGVCGDFPT